MNFREEILQEESIPGSGYQNDGTGNMISLYELISKVIQFTSEDDIYEYVGRKLSLVYDDALIIINKNNPDAGTMTINSICFPDKNLLGRAMKYLGYNPKGKIYPMKPDAKELFELGELVRYPGGLLKLAEGYEQQQIIRKIIDLLDLDDVHLIGLSGNKKLFAGIQIYRFKKSKSLNHRFIETFVNHASAVLQKLYFERQLKESEERFKLLSDLTFEGIVLHKNGTLLDCNQSLIDMTGFDLNDMRGKNIIDTFVHPYYRELVKNKIRMNYAGPYEIMIFKKDGELLPVEIEAKNTNHNGEIIRTASVRDISKRKNAETLLRESEEKYRTFIEHSTDAVVLTDENGRIIEWNYAQEELTSIERNNALGMYVWDMQYELLPKELKTKTKRDSFKKVFKEILKENGSAIPLGYYEVPIESKDGKRKIIQQSGFVIETSKGRRLGSITRDITKIKEDHKKINDQNKELEKLNVAKDKFFSIIAHDLRSPFNGLIGLSEYILKNQENLTFNELQEMLLSFNDSTSNLYNLLNNLLSWAKSQTGTLDFNPKKLALQQLCSDTIKLSKESARSKNIELIADYPDEEILVEADPDLIKTVLRNLLSNAVKFTPKGGKIVFECKEKNEDNVLIAIKDNGIGMNKYILDSLFKIDKNLSRKCTYNEKGTGLGLLLCKEFVEMHGGNIWVESKPEKGSTFYFTLKRLPA